MRDLPSLIIQVFQIAQITPSLRYMTIYHLTMPYDHYERANLVDLYAGLATTPRRIFKEYSKLNANSLNSVDENYINHKYVKYCLQSWNDGQLPSILNEIKEKKDMEKLIDNISNNS
ncbi:unnamed protein product, partial [Didymodactylos carnosus]